METEIEAPTDVEAIVEDVAPEVETVEGFDEGQAEVGDTANEPPEHVLNLDEFSDYMVDLGNGEYIPASELKGGGLRQSDYTRKTQEIAEMRKSLERAETLDRSLQVNPQGTLEYLAKQHGLTLSQAQQVMDQQQADDDYWGDGGGTAQDPTEARLAAIEARFAQEEAEREVTDVFNRLEAKYGEDFDRTEVSKAAVQAGIYDPNMLEMVYRNMAFEKLTMARQQATTQAQQQAAAQEAARKKAAAEAAAATGASGSAVGIDDAAPPPRNLTVREAAELAWSQLYGDS